MKKPLPPSIYDLPELRERLHVFRNRTHAGEILADMLTPYIRKAGIVMAIPAGGVPVGIAVSERLDMPFDLAVVSKITLPWNTEAGYGAVAFDGTVRLNNALLSTIRLSESEIETGIAETMEKVGRRMRKLRGSDPFPDLSGRMVVLVDDGLASGFTMQVAVEAVKNAEAKLLTVAVPTAHRESIIPVAEMVDALFCPNIRSGWRYAVADAYKRWTDVDEAEVAALLGKR